MNEKEYRIKFARSGGLARAKKMTKKQRSEHARKMVMTRWDNYKKDHEKKEKESDFERESKLEINYPFEGRDE